MSLATDPRSLPLATSAPISMFRDPFHRETAFGLRLELHARDVVEAHRAAVLGVIGSAWIAAKLLRAFGTVHTLTL